MLKLEIADSPAKHERGLMYRNNLPWGEGMLFLFDRPQRLRFWGANTLIPLDIAFVNSDDVITKISQIEPLSLRAVESDDLCDKAVEVKHGYFLSQRISVGDKIKWFRDDDGFAKLSFASSHTKTAQSNPYPSFHNKPITLPAGLPPIEDVNEPQSDIAARDVQQSLPRFTADELAELTEDGSSDAEMIPGVDWQQPDEVPEPLPPDDSSAPAVDEPLSTEDVPDDSDYPTFSTTAEAMDWAARKKQRVRIWYNTDEGNNIERQIEPHGVFVAGGTGNTLIAAFDRNVNDIRTYIADRILYYSFEGQRFKPKFIVEDPNAADNAIDGDMSIQPKIE